MKRTLSAQHLKVQKGCTEPVTPISLTGQIRPVRLQANHQSARKPVHLTDRPLTLIQSTGTIPFSSKYSLQCVKCSFPSHSPLRRTAKGEGCIAFNTLCLFIVYVNQSLLALCYTSPQHKDDMLTISIQRPDNGIRKTLPLVLPMAVRLILVYGQCRIQQQHPLFSPACKIARKLIGAVKAHPECIV